MVGLRVEWNSGELSVLVEVMTDIKRLRCQKKAASQGKLILAFNLSSELILIGRLTSDRPNDCS